MATDGRHGSAGGPDERASGPFVARDPAAIVFRCHGCGVRFPDDPGGPGRCPRCGAIGGHERLGRSSD